MRVPAASVPIDWSRPWLAPWREPGERIDRAVAQGMALHEALNREAARRGLCLRFVPQAALPEGEAYERFVFRTGTCPVRPGLHDFFNGLCWLRRPHAKRLLNRLQAAEIARHGVQPVRGPLRDALTLFDENGALLRAPAPLWDALRARDWPALFVTHRARWAEARLVLFGHALLEKLVSPYKSITAHVHDPRAAGPRPFVPLPVLGVPGWWMENANFSFYDDSLVFRPPRALPEPTTTAEHGLHGAVA